MLHHFRYPYSLYVYLHGAPPIFRVNATNFHKLRQVWFLECLGLYQPCTRCLLQISQQTREVLLHCISKNIGEKICYRVPTTLFEVDVPLIEVDHISPRILRLKTTKQETTIHAMLYH